MKHVLAMAGLVAFRAKLGAVNTHQAKGDDQPARDIVDTAVSAG